MTGVSDLNVRAFVARRLGVRLAEVLEAPIEVVNAMSRYINAQDRSELHWDTSDGPNPECGSSTCMDLGTHYHPTARLTDDDALRCRHGVAMGCAPCVEEMQRPTWKPA